MHGLIVILLVIPGIGVALAISVVTNLVGIEALSTFHQVDGDDEHAHGGLRSSHVNLPGNLINKCLGPVRVILVPRLVVVCDTPRISNEVAFVSNTRSICHLEGSQDCVGVAHGDAT